MSAIPLNEAWNLEPEEAGPTAERPIVELARVSAKLPLLVDEQGPPPASRAKRKGEVGELVALIAELRALRKEHTRQQQANVAVVYGAAAISVVLLVILLHTLNRIHHTTECLLWNAKRT